MERSKNHKTANGTFTKNVDIYMFQVSFFSLWQVSNQIGMYQLGKGYIGKIINVKYFSHKEKT